MANEPARYSRIVMYTCSLQCYSSININVISIITIIIVTINIIITIVIISVIIIYR